MDPQTSVSTAAGGQGASSAQATATVQQLKQFYERFSAGNIARLEEIYTPDVEFRDPVHTLRGALALRNYLRRMAVNLQHYQIRYIEELVGANQAWLTWEMDFGHRHLRGGRTITVRGMTHVSFTTKVFYHEDCYDLGALVYEHVPALGFATRKLKQNLGRKD